MQEGVELAALDRAPDGPATNHGLRLHWVTVVILCAGLPLTALLAWVAGSIHRTTEDRLLDQRANEASVILSGNRPATIRTLEVTASVAEASHADPTELRRIVLPQLGATILKPLVSVSVWSVDDLSKPVLVVGTDPTTIAPGAQPLPSFMGRTERAEGLVVRDLLRSPRPGLGYGITDPAPGNRYVVYGETAIAPGRTKRVREEAAFVDLDFALYLGRNVEESALLYSSTDQLPLRGHTARASSPIGDTVATLVIKPHRELSGDLPARLPWLILLAGSAASVGFALLAERLTRKGRLAEMLAADNADLYQAQRSVAETLQRSLLPDRLPDIDDLEVSVRYEPGVEGIEIGGDWYDVMEVDDDRVMLVVGDVSGRGLSAGTVMASLRFAIRAHATQGDSPGTVLTKLATMLSVVRDQHFATVLCVSIDRSASTITVANAGHPKMLLLGSEAASFLDTPVGPPIGVDEHHRYVEQTLPLPAAATFLMFTDGLFERRGESIEAGMERLRVTVLAEAPGASLDQLLSAVLADMVPGGAADDTALLGARWREQAGATSQGGGAG
jgi:serine phosphatase RsbU (regulator of sigma subunit)